MEPEVAILDMEVERVVARLRLEAPAHHMAVAKARGELVVASLEDGAITVYDLRTLTPVRRVALDHQPELIQLDPSGEVVAASSYAADAVTLLRLADMTARRVDGLHAPHNLVFADSGQRLYVANLGADIVSVIEVATARIAAEIAIPRPAGTDPGITDLHLAADGRRAWAVPVSGGDLAEIDLAAGTARPGVEAGPLPWRIAGTADGRHLITGNEGDGSISLLDAASGEAIARLPGGRSVSGVLPAWFDSLAFVLSREHRAVHVVDLEQATSRASVALPGAPEAGLVSADGAKLLVALADGDALAVIDARDPVMPRIIEGVVPEPSRITAAGARNICD
jgi:YVTN family beta-propeller protein